MVIGSISRRMNIKTGQGRIIQKPKLHPGISVVKRLALTSNRGKLRRHTF